MRAILMQLSFWTFLFVISTFFVIPGALLYLLGAAVEKLGYIWMTMGGLIDDRPSNRR